MSKWEYKVLNHNSRAIYSNDEGIEKQLNAYGNEGWELVSAIPFVDGSGSDGDMNVSVSDIKFVFKRSK